MHEVLVNRLGGLSLPRKSVVRLTDRLDMTLDVYRGRKTTIQPTNIVAGHQRGLRTKLQAPIEPFLGFQTLVIFALVPSFPTITSKLPAQRDHDVVVTSIRHDDVELKSA